MAKISGVSVELITKLGGVSKQLVRKLGSKLTAELGFGPDYNPGPTCETLSMSYSSVSLADAVNNGTGINVEIGDNGIWYAEGSCGNFTAGTGYYFLDDGNREVFYFYWDAETEELSELEAPADGPTCETVTSFYSAVSLWDAYDAGIETTIEIGDNGIWYLESSCGGDFATTGYYVIEGRRREFFYYFWDASAQTLTELEAPQPPVVGPTNTSSPNLFANFAYPLLWTSTSLSVNRGTWTGTGNISYTYNWYSDGSLIATQGPYPTTDTKGNILDPQPTIPIGANQMFETLELQITATDDNGSTTVSTSTQIQDATLNTFLSNSGITDPTRVAALEYLRKSLATSTTQLLYQTNMDYYPFAGETDEQNKWSLGNPSEYLQFIGGWSHSGDGSQANYGIAQSTRAYNNSFNNIQFAYGMYTNTDEVSSFDDLRLSQTYGNQSYAWSFRPQQIVNGINKVYWTTVSTTGVVGEETYNVSAGSVGLSGLYRNRNNIGVNQMFVISAGIQQDPVSFYGNFGPYNSSPFTIGHGTKNYQFAFIANFLTNEQTTELNTILQTYNSMLGR